MKVRRVTMNHRKGRLELVTYSGKVYPVPYARLDPKPSAQNKVVGARVDPELGREAVTYTLEAGDQGSVHIDQALEYNQDPGYLAELLIHRLTVEACRRVDGSGLSRRDLARRLQTSVPQIYRLLDPTNTTKGLSQLVTLLHVLGCEIELVVKSRTAA